MASLVSNQSYLNSKDSDSDEEVQNPNVTEEMLEEAKAQAIEFKAEGNAFFSVQDYDNAIKKYTAAINCIKNVNLPKDAILLLNRSAAYIGAKRYVPALNDANQAVEIDPSNWKSHWRKAISLMSMSKRRFRTIQAVDALEACLSCGTLPESKIAETKSELEKAKRRCEQQDAETPPADLSNCAPS